MSIFKILGSELELTQPPSLEVFGTRMVLVSVLRGF